MSSFRTPNFRGRQALVLHRPDAGTAKLSRQLERLGMSVQVCWPDFPEDGDYADVVFFDADSGFDGQFPWAGGEAPMPLIALLGSELPGRLEWAINQSFSAHILKPVQSTGIFSALVIAFSNFEKGRGVHRQIDALQSRLEGRQSVIRAVVTVMEAGDLDDEAAFAQIRAAAMSRRMTIEDFCVATDAFALRKIATGKSRSRNRLGHK